MLFVLFAVPAAPPAATIAASKEPGGEGINDDDDELEEEEEEGSLVSFERLGLATAAEACCCGPLAPTLCSLRRTAIRSARI